MQAFKLSHKALILVFVPLLLELSFIVVLNFQLSESQKQTQEANKARAIIDDTSMVCKTAYDAVNCIYSSMHDPKSELFEQYIAAKKNTVAHLRSLFERLKDRPQQEKDSAVRLKQAVGQQFRNLEAIQSAVKEGNRPRLMRLAMNFYGKDSPFGVMARELEFLTKQEEAAANVDTESRSRDTIRVMLWIGVAVNILVAAMLVAFFNRSTILRLGILMDNAARLSKKQPLADPVGGHDEIAQLDFVFHQTASELARVDKLKQEFVSMISHDLRSPLTSLEGTLILLEKGAYGDLNESGKKRVTGSTRSVKHLIKLINDLLDVDRLESGKMDLEIKETVILQVLERSVESVRTFAEQQRVNVVFEQTDAVLMADPDRLCQVVTNLVSNAIKFSPPESEVKLSVEQNSEWITVNVTDSGRGIPEDKIATIFDRFKQVEHKDATEKGGSGLGLSICKAIVESHGGQIGVSSKAGEGSTFWFKLSQGPATFTGTNPETPDSASSNTSTSTS